MFIPEPEDRGYFASNRYRTKAFERIIEHSKPQAQKDLETQITEMFMKFQIKELKYTLSEIHEIFFNKKYQISYLREILQKNMKMFPNQKTERYRIPVGFTESIFNEKTTIIYKESRGNCYTFKASDFVEDLSEFEEFDVNELPF